ncbi:MAG: sugar phosphate nucleotidyltransferase [bacterium]
MKLNAFIPAAGFGERLRPLSLHIPKPLFPIVGRPIIEYVLDTLLDLPIEAIGINLHHLGPQIKQWIESSNLNELIQFFPENPLMGTGGALYNAKDFLKGHSFLVYNSDILCDFDICAFYHFHKKSENIVTLAVHNVDIYNHVGLDEGGRVVCVGKKGRAENVKRFVTFTGIAMYEPAFLGFLPEGISHVTDAWLKAVESGEKIGTFDISRFRWRDLGTVGAYVDTILEEISQRPSNRFIGPNINVPLDCELTGIIVLESFCQIGTGVRLENCIVHPGGIVKDGEKIKDCLIYSDKKIPIKIHEKYTHQVNTMLGTGGSDRLYTRVRLVNGTCAVQLKTSMIDPDLKRQIDYTHYFKEHNMPVPGIVSYDLKRGRALFEDLGDFDLFTWFHTGRAREEILQMYKMVLSRLILFQSIDPAGENSLRSWIFDYDTFCWESEYFLNRFIKGYCKIVMDSEKALRREFAKLARKADSYPKMVIHRDFQSQNIMLKQGNIYFIDYQGARIGPPAYDAVSLIFDPYCPLEQDVENELCDYYIKELVSKANYNSGELKDSLIYCRMQRHMQALGAYGYLSRVKGKKGFESYIPRAVALLSMDVSYAASEFPALYELLKSLPSVHGSGLN